MVASVCEMAGTGVQFSPEVVDFSARHARRPVRPSSERRLPGIGNSFDAVVSVYLGDAHRDRLGGSYVCLAPGFVAAPELGDAAAIE